MGLLQGKVALVTGAGSGIGRSVAEAYAREGATVVVSDIVDAHGLEVVHGITAAGGEAHYARADVADAEQVRRLVEETVERFGGLHVACNNAGIGGPAKLTGEYGIDEWRKVLGINLDGVFYGMRYQIPAMLASGGGAIVNMASILGNVGFATAPAYVAAKHGVVGLTKTAAMEYATQGVRVNAVGPGFISTPLLSAMDEETLAGIAAMHPVNRLGRPEEVADAVVYLSSDKASFVTGAYLPVDGGYLTR
ncbi:MAG: 3-oxoacyl-ACP reductase FabG [Trueperaceae bacterium]